MNHTSLPNAGFRLVSFLLVLAAFASGLRPAEAQPPQPVITFVFPAGAQQGQTVEATINGREFQNASGVRISGPGVTANIVEVVNSTSVRISLAVASDAELGERDLRLITPGGISNRVRFIIGALPETNEVEPKHGPRSAAERRDVARPDQRSDPRQRPR